MNSKTYDEVKNIVDKLPENHIIAQDILSALGNTSTKIEQDKDIKNSYYVYLKDTIYLSDNEKIRKNKNRLCLIAHECRHSIQSKVMQKLNFILSNIQIIVSILSIILSFFYKSNVIIYSFIVISILTIIPRIILEIDAVISSTKIANDYLAKKVSSEEKKIVINEYEKNTRRYLPLFIISFFDKRLIIIGILILIKIFI